MTDIRPFERADLQAVVALLEARLPWWTHEDSFLTETLIDSSWAEPDLASLVAVDAQGELLGFIGAQARRVRFGDRSLRGICCAHLVVSADPKAGPAGALLMRRLLSGDQDLTWTDSPTSTVVRIWRAFGGHLDHPRSCDWMLVLRPFPWARGIVAAKIRRAPLRQVLPVAAVPIQASGGRLLPQAFPAPPADVASEPTGAAAIVQNLPALTRGIDLYVDYDQPYLEQLFTQVEAVMGGLELRMVKRDGRPIGWYAYLARPGGASRVLHICAPEPEIEAVVGELVDRAREVGSAALTGRLEPHLEGPLRRRLAVIGFARQPVIHVRDPEVHAMLATSSSLLTHLDGEWYVT
jgi:hypothetical protein